jgi:uncharacterized MAPEG superfamily protein
LKDYSENAARKAKNAKQNTIPVEPSMAASSMLAAMKNNARQTRARLKT